MLDFRKVLLALSVAGLGLVGIAQAAPNVCTAIAPTTFEGSVAIEGTTESLPSVTITCNTQPVVGALTLLLTANVPFTNQPIAAHSTSVDVVVTDNGGDTNGAVPSNAPTVTQPGTSTIQIVFPSVTGNLTTVTVTGLRVNPSGLPALSQVTVSLGSPSIAVTAAAANMAYVQKTLSAVTIAGAANQTACGLLATTNVAVATTTITNGFPDSFKQVSEYTNGSVVTATQGTTLAVTFSNLNPGVNYYVPLNIPNPLVGGSIGLTAQNSPTGTTAATAVTINGTGNQVLLTVVNGSATIYYQVIDDAVSGTESFAIPLIEVVPSVGGVTTYSATPVAVSVTLVGAASGYPQFSSSQTAYTATQAPPASSNGLLTPCSTTLLFPYVINVAGFDTGIAIANASTIPTGITVAGLAATSGSCNVTFYGTGAPTTNPYSTGTVTTGTVTPFDVGTVAPGFSGYAVAVCNFQGAHGYAFVSDGLGTGTGIGANYLAIVLADNPVGGNVTPTAF